jgi:hypothetical protein
VTGTTYRPPGWLHLGRTVLRAVLARPGLWWVACQTLRRLAPSHWWKRWPFLPLPDPSYWDFRLATAYGGETSGGVPGKVTASAATTRGPSSDDVVAFLNWCRRMPTADR